MFQLISWLVNVAQNVFKCWMYFLTFLCLYTNSLYFRGQHARDRSLTRVCRTPSLCWQGMRREEENGNDTEGETRGGKNLEDRQKTAGKRKGKTEGGRFSVNKLKTAVRYERRRAAPCLPERRDSVGGFLHLQRRWATCLEDQKTALHAALSQADWKAFIFI